MSKSATVVITNAIAALAEVSLSITTVVVRAPVPLVVSTFKSFVVGLIAILLAAITLVAITALTQVSLAITLAAIAALSEVAFVSAVAATAAIVVAAHVLIGV